MQAVAEAREEGPGTAGAFACPPPPAARTSAREQLQQLEQLARAELALLQLRAAAQPATAMPCPEQASVAWDLGLDAADL